MQFPVDTMAIFQDGGEYFLVEVRTDGKISLKRKVNGWSDTWSLPLEDSDIK
jgi:hypothetical protein